jgi:hypothetical protein
VSRNYSGVDPDPSHQRRSDSISRGEVQRYGAGNDRLTSGPACHPCALRNTVEAARGWHRAASSHRRQSMTTTIFPPASLASITRCASRISVNLNTRAGFALKRPDAAFSAICRSGTSDSGNAGVPK